MTSSGHQSWMICSFARSTTQGSWPSPCLGLLLLVAYIGYRLGLRLHAAADQAREYQIGAVQAAVLGMLGLLLGFTFSMGVERYDRRRELVLQDANTIGTTWLRASLLPEGYRQAVRDLLREYVDLRIRAQQEARDPGRLAEDLRRSAEIKTKLWAQAEAAAREAPNDITATFIDTLNEMIDTDAERLGAWRNRIPSGVWVILMVVAGVGCWTTAYAAGADGVRSPLTNVMLPLLITVVILLIFDLTHERGGMVDVSQQPLLDLQNSIRSAPAGR